VNKLSSKKLLIINAQLKETFLKK